MDATKGFVIPMTHNSCIFKMLGLFASLFFFTSAHAESTKACSDPVPCLIDAGVNAALRTPYPSQRMEHLTELAVFAANTGDREKAEKLFKLALRESEQLPFTELAAALTYVTDQECTVGFITEGRFGLERMLKNLTDKRAQTEDPRQNADFTRMLAMYHYLLGQPELGRLELEAYIAGILVLPDESGTARINTLSWAATQIAIYGDGDDDLKRAREIFIEAEKMASKLKFDDPEEPLKPFITRLSLASDQGRAGFRDMALKHIIFLHKSYPLAVGDTSIPQSNLVLHIKNILEGKDAPEIHACRDAP